MPTSPGVYWFLDGDDKVLYVGKAKNIKNRLSQYAHRQDERTQIDSLLAQTQTVKFAVLESELEALLVEAELIKKYQPHYNILLKDDKSNLYICIGPGSFPKIFTARKLEILHTQEKWTTFGPFQSGYKVRQVLEIARRIFQWCDKPSQRQLATGDRSQSKEKVSVANDLSPLVSGHNVRPCFYYHLGLCSGACIGAVDAEAYDAMIAALKKFLRGRTSELVRQFKTDIAAASLSQQFEKAALLRDQLHALITVTSPKYRLRPDMTLPVLTMQQEAEALISLRATLREYLSIAATAPLGRIEGYDISNIQGTNASCSMVTAIDGKLDHSEYKHFGIKTLNTPNDYAMLQEALTRRQQHPEWGIPDVVLIDGGKGQLRSVLSVWHWPSVVVSIAKKPDRLIIPLSLQGQSRKQTDTLRLTYKEVPLTPDLPATRLLQSIRDESHRFAKRLHSIKRTKALISSS